MKVPDYQRLSHPAELPTLRQDINVNQQSFLPATEAAFAEQAAQGLRQLDQGLERIYDQQLQAANHSRVADARNRTQQFLNDLSYGKQGLLQRQGAEAFQPEANGRSAIANGLQSLDEHIAAVSDGLGNDQQRLLYREWADAARLHAAAGFQQHEGQQLRVYQRQVGQASIDTQAQTIALNYNNPQLLEQGMAAIHQASLDLARLEGQPEQAGQLQALTHGSKALSLALAAALQHDDDAAAAAILHNHAAQMRSEDLIHNRQLLGKRADARTAYAIADRVMAGVAQDFNPDAWQRMRNITFAAESGGRQFAADGLPLTSAAGAKGVGQLLESTAKEAAALAGLAWQPELFHRAASGDAKRDAEAEQYNRTLADAYLRRQLQNFQGDPGLAWAAYHAGAAATRQALAQAEQHGGNWLAYLPQATRQYVGDNLQAFVGGAGQDHQPGLPEVQRQALAQLGEDSRPELRKQVVDEVTNQYRMQKQALKQRQAEGRAAALRGLLANGGQYSALPVQVQAGVAAKDIEAVQVFARQLAAGKQPATDWSLYYKLKSDPALLQKTNLMAFRHRLQDSEFKQLADAQQNAVQAQSPVESEARDVLYQYMREAGINPQPRSGDKAGMETAGRIWSVFQQRLNAAEQHKGKALGSEEINQLAAQLFTKVGVKNLLFGSSEKPAVLVDWKTDRVQVPDADRAQIIQALRQLKPEHPISEDDIFYSYLHHKGLL